MTARVALASQRAVPGGAQRSMALLAPALRHLGWDPVGVVGEDGWLGRTLRDDDIEVVGSVEAAHPSAVVSMGAATHAWAGRDAGELGVPAAWWLELTLRGRPAEAAAVATPATLAATPTAAAADALRRRAPGLDVEVVAPAVDPGPVDAHRTAAATLRATLPRGAAVVVQVARLDPAKGQDTAIEAVRRVAGRGRPVHLVVVGGAIVGHEGDLEQCLRSAAAPGLVTFTGHVDDPGPWHAVADVAICPSHHEAFGLAIVEALAHGTPMVASDTDGPREILDGGRLGELVAPEDPEALAAAIERSLDRPHDPGPGIERARSFSPAAAAARWDRLLHRLQQ